MNTDFCFFPCAGLGTRMGSVGEVLPKPLWPIFESTLVGAQLKYSRGLGFENYCINTHHQAEKLSAWAKEQEENISLYFERSLLGSGGCFHNIKSFNDSLDSLFIFNPDSFLILKKSDWDKFFKLAKEVDHLLIATPCKKEDPYNRLIVSEGILEKIIPPSADAPPVTYSGFGKISLKKIEEHEGISSFFDTVAIPGKAGPAVFVPEEEFEFWDFGTVESYKENIKKLISNNDSYLRKFLESASLINPAEVYKNSYKSKDDSVINFTGEKLSVEKPGIYLKIDGKVTRLE